MILHVSLGASGYPHPSPKTIKDGTKSQGHKTDYFTWESSVCNYFLIEMKDFVEIIQSHFNKA